MPFPFKREAHLLLALVVVAPVAGGVLAIPVPRIARVAFAVAPSEQPSLKTVVERLGQYVAGYGEHLSVLVGVERYDQRVLETKVARSLLSEIALVPAGRDWLAYRDVFEVDGRKIRDRTDRLQRLILDSPATAFEQARRIADESARFNLGGIQRNFNTPTMCLFSFRPENRERFKFKKSGDEPRGARDLWKIRYEEKERPTIVRSPTGRSLPMAGYVWVRPDTGEVFRTVMEIDGDVRASVTVDYERDAKLDVILPVRMHEVYRGVPSPGTGREASTIECDAAYSDFKRFETSARLVVPK